MNYFELFDKHPVAVSIVTILVAAIVFDALSDVAVALIRRIKENKKSKGE